MNVRRLLWLRATTTYTIMSILSECLHPWGGNVSPPCQRLSRFWWWRVEAYARESVTLKGTLLLLQLVSVAKIELTPGLAGWIAWGLDTAHVKDRMSCNNVSEANTSAKGAQTKKKRSISQNWRTHGDLRIRWYTLLIIRIANNTNYLSSKRGLTDDKKSIHMTCKVSNLMSWKICYSIGFFLAWFKLVNDETFSMTYFKQSDSRLAMQFAICFCFFLE